MLPGLFLFCPLLIALSLLSGLGTRSEESVTSLTEAKENKDKLLLFTVATDTDHDGLRRLRHSAAHYGIRLHVLGANIKWLGYGTKLKIIHRVLTADYLARQGEGATVLLYVDAYDVLVDGGEEEILRRFNEHFASHGAKIVFGAEQICLKDPSGLDCNRFPEVETSQRYINSGLYMGYAEDLIRLWDEFVPLIDEMTQDDQVFYIKKYTDSAIRERYGIELDHHSRLFHNFPEFFSSALKPVEASLPLQFDESTGQPYVFNVETKTRAVLVHGFAKIPYLYTLSNYIAGRFNLHTGCGYCNIDDELAQTPSSKLPLVGLALIMAGDGGNDTVGDFLELASRLDYPPERIALFAINIRQDEKEAVAKFVEVAKSERRYKSIKAWNLDNDKVRALTERTAKIAAVNWAEKSKFDFMFMLDDAARVENPITLKRLVLLSTKYELGFLAPLLHFKRGSDATKDESDASMKANFWGDVHGHIGITTVAIRRSIDFNEIVSGRRRNYWNVACIFTSALLVANRKFSAFRDSQLTYVSMGARKHVDIAFCQYSLDRTHHMFIDNQVEYGWTTRAEIGGKSVEMAAQKVEGDQKLSSMDSSRRTDEL